MANRQKLELTWIGKDKRPCLEPRILLEDVAKSYHAKARVSESDCFDNKLILGDNLLALKALQQSYAGRVKCVYIDPPFNTGGAFQHYDDNLEHSIWLGLIRDRLELLRSLLTPDGAVVVNLDDTEMAYCKVLLDEVFGRSNYVVTIVVVAATPSSFKTVNTGPTEVAQYLLFYAKDKGLFRYQPQYVAEHEVDLQHFSRFVVNADDPADRWAFRSINDHILETLGFSGDTPNAKWLAAKKAMGAEDAKETVKIAATRFALENCDRVFETKTLQKPSKWLHSHIEASVMSEHVIELPREGMDSIYLYKGRQIYFLGKGVREIEGEKVVVQPLSNLWDDIPTNNLKKEGGVDFPAGKKPEMLIARIIRMICSDTLDIVLDSFAGSGTTGAVAHKMGFRWVMVELGEHCDTHIIPRLKRVIDGQDPDGMTGALHWKGGGGFRYYRLAPSLLEKDSNDNYIISKQYNAAMLSEAMCKQMNFNFSPSDTVYWQQGKSSETDFIYVTTQVITSAQAQSLSAEVGPHRSLMVCCSATRGKVKNLHNLTIVKIPAAVLDRCEWGKDDYSLNVANLPMAQPEPIEDATPQRATKKKAENKAQAALFGEGK